MSATISITGLEIECVIGVLPAEREAPQRIVADLEFDRGVDAAVHSDSVADTADYVEVAAAVIRLAVDGRFGLLETLASRTADLLLERFGARRAAVKIMKPGAIPAAAHAAVFIQKTPS